MELNLIGDGSNTLRKPVEALVMVPRTHKLSPLARKMYTVFLYVTQQTLRQMGAIPPGNYLFEAPLSEVLRAAGAEGQSTMAKTYLAEMRKVEVSWDTPDADYGATHIGFNMISETRIVKRNGAVFFQWALPPTLLDVLVDPKRWASINLLYLGRLKRYASIVLYEICSRYKNNPTHLTCRMPVEWWTELLTATPTTADPLTGKPKVIEWRKYKNKYLNAAIKEINENTDLTINLIEDKHGGKSIKDAQFFIKIKEDARQVPQIEVKIIPISEKLLQAAKSVKIEDLKDLQVLLNKHNEQSVLNGIERLRVRMAQDFSPPVESPIGLLRHYLVSELQRAVEVLDKPDIVPARLGSPDEATAKVQRPLFDDQSSSASWLTNRHAELLEELKAMPAEDVRTWLTAYGESLKAKNMMTPTTRDRIESVAWYASPRVRLEMVKFYALSKYGDSWDVPPASPLVVQDQ